MRDRQRLFENSVGSGRLSCAALRSRRQICRRGSSGLGLCAVALHARTVSPDSEPGRHHPATSGRTCHRLAHWRVPGSCCDGRCSGGAQPVLAPRQLAARWSSFVPCTVQRLASAILSSVGRLHLHAGQAERDVNVRVAKIRQSTDTNLSSELRDDIARSRLQRTSYKSNKRKT